MIWKRVVVAFVGFISGGHELIESFKSVEYTHKYIIIAIQFEI